MGRVRQETVTRLSRLLSRPALVQIAPLRLGQETFFVDKPDEKVRVSRERIGGEHVFAKKKSLARFLVVRYRLDELLHLRLQHW